ncbi:SMAD/FHA domain-containing protein, partial [Rhodotorula sp. JG-1b]
RSPPPPRRRDDGRYTDRDRDRDRDRDQGRARSRSPPPPAKAGGGGDGGWGRRELAGEGGGSSSPPPKPVEPDFKPSGALAAETKCLTIASRGNSTLNGVVLKYAEPPEARKPVRNWRLYVFKGKEQVELFHVHRQSAYLIGRDRIVADIPVDHPSASKQHAVLQFRQVIERNEFGDSKSLTKPFIIDLDSANGTMVNDEAVPASRFYELRSGDVLKFAFSTREYVLL